MQLVQNVLQKILSAKPRNRKTVLKRLSNREIKLLCEVCLNLIHGNLKITDSKSFKRLKRGRKVISELADKRKPIGYKKRLINQKGGFIATIAAATLPVIISEVARLIRG